MPNRRIVLPVALVKRLGPDAVMLLRIGAGVNVMEASQRLMLQIDDNDRPAAMLCRVHSALAAIAYWREIVKMIERERFDERLWALVQRAIQQGFDLGLPLSEARSLLSPSHPDIGGPALLKVRDKISFHWDPQPFQSFIDDAQTTEVIVWESDGDRNTDRIFRASSDALARFLVEIAGSENALKGLLPLVAKAQGLAGKVVEAGFVGLLIEGGEDPHTYWNRGHEA